jgi:membrane protein YqaA with SNARE-associated domain
MPLQTAVFALPWSWLRHLGGAGLIALGIADASLVPMPGSLDALTIVLAASNRPWWLYYAGMATVGSLVGSYFTFRIGREGGKEALEKRISKKRVEQVYETFARGGFGAIFVPALLPPPVPLVPFVLAAGALNYPTKRFLTALGLSRAIRYSALGLLASIYGRTILGFFAHYYKPVLWSLLGLAVAGGIGVLVWLKKRQSHASQSIQRDAAA